MSDLLTALDDAATTAGAPVALVDGAAFSKDGAWLGGAARAALGDKPAPLTLMLAPPDGAEPAFAAAERRAFEAWIAAAALEMAPARRLNGLRRRHAPLADAVAALNLMLAAPSITGQVVDLG